MKIYHIIESLQRKYIYLLLLVFTFLLYGNTLGHQYAQDDAIVITDNMFTQDGVSGISGHLTNDTFFGFFKKEGKAKLVSGGRYRPLTPIMFCLEYEAFGLNPFVSHLINVLMYWLLCIAIFSLLALLFAQSESINQPTSLALIITLLFLAHPVHTEAVANIKGRDEIMAMLGAVIAFWASIKYFDTGSFKYVALGTLSIFFGLLSKENTITFLAVIPLGLFHFRALFNKKNILPVAGIVVGILAFLVIRTSILGFDLGGKPMELMNNPFLAWNGSSYDQFSFSEKAGNILICLGQYLRLMAWPSALIHDYYPRSIGIVSLTDWKAIFSLLIHILMLIAIVLYWKKNTLVSFGIAYYFVTLSIVSNIVFPIGTNMSERFLFMPSLGLLIALVGGLKSLDRKVMTIVVAYLFLGFSIRTIIRNPVWYDDFTLFTTDVRQGTRSAKLLNAAGGVIITKYVSEPDSPAKSKALKEAIGYLNQALEIHPTYKNPFLLLGNGYYYLKDYDNAIASYEAALRLDPDFKDAMTNLPIVLRDAARHYGEKEQNVQKALTYLKQSIQLSPDDIETMRLLGISYGMTGDHANAIKYFKKVADKSPSNASAFVNLGIAYKNAGDQENARIQFEQAVSIDPAALNHMQQNQ